MRKNDKEAEQALEYLEQAYAYYTPEDAPVIEPENHYEDLPFAA